jgi:hypothetical protein
VSYTASAAEGIVVVIGKWRRSARRGGSPVDRRADRALAVPALLAIAEHAVSLRPATQAFLNACTESSETPPAVAVQGHRLATEYNRLHAWVLDTPTVDDLAALRNDLASQLQYHCVLVHDAVRFAFPKVRTPSSEAHRATLAHLGPPAAELSDTLARLTALAEPPVGP